MRLACQGISQSSPSSIAPRKQPNSAPKAGKTRATSRSVCNLLVCQPLCGDATRWSQTHSARLNSLIQVCCTAALLAGTGGAEKGAERAYADGVNASSERKAASNEVSVTFLEYQVRGQKR